MITQPKGSLGAVAGATAGEPAGKKNGYAIAAHSYPIDLTSNPRYGGNFVMFFINVMEDSALAKSKTATFVTPDKSTVGDRGETLGAGFTKDQATGAAAFIGLAGGTIAGGDGAGGAKGALLLGGGAAVIPGKSELTRPVKRMETAICLYMPNQLNIRYGVQYEEMSMALPSMVMKGGEAIMQALQGDLGKASDAGRDIIANFALTNGGSTLGIIGFGSGLAANPKKEQVFKGVDFRTFQINYQFFPKDEKEAKNVQNIIHAFKYHMHPEFKSPDGFLYIYPSEFDIVYYTGNQENLNLHKHTSCVLKDMNVNYTPQGQFNAFPDGTPMQINIDMTFIELALVTKEKIKENPGEGGL